MSLDKLVFHLLLIAKSYFLSCLFTSSLQSESKKHFTLTKMTVLQPIRFSAMLVHVLSESIS